MLRNEWLAHLDGLVVFRGLLAAEPLRSLHAALAADEDALTGAVAAFEAALFARGTNWTEALLDAVLEEENLCLRVAAGQDAGPVLETALNSELDFLQTLGRAPLDEVFPGAAVFLPRWETTPDADYHAAYEARRAAMGQTWIFRDIDHYLATGILREPPTVREVGSALLDHLRDHYALHGDWAGVRSARKHIGWYVAGLPGGDALRQTVNALEDAEAQWQAVHDWLDALGEHHLHWPSPAADAARTVENWRPATPRAAAGPDSRNTTKETAIPWDMNVLKNACAATC